MKHVAVASSILLGLAIFAAPASAQPGTVAPAPVVDPEPVPAPKPRPSGEGEPLSENTALGLSIAGTVGSWALVIGSAMAADENGQAGEMLSAAAAFGVVFGPSFGHWYSGKFATRGLGLRAAGMVTMVVGAVVALSECPLFSDEPCDAMGGTALAITGAGLFVGGTIDDIVTAPRRVRQHNERLAGLALAPVVTSRSAGLALGGRF